MMNPWQTMRGGGSRLAPVTLSKFQIQSIPAPVVLGAVLLMCFGYNLGVPPLFDLDEGAFSAATWEMLQRGDFITTYLNGELRFDKPILIYWLQAASVSLFGLNEWALRLPSAIAASLWVVAVYGFARQRLEPTEGANVGVNAGLAAALIAAFSIGVVVIGRAATADALLNLLITLTLLDIIRYFQRPDFVLRNRVYVWIGLGLLTKGPIAIIVPLAVSLMYVAIQKRWQDWLRAVFNPLGWVIMLAIALPWYILQYQAQGQAFIDGFFLKHNVGRFSSTMEGHGGSLLYYVPVVLLIILPFAGLLLRILPRIKQAFHEPLDLWLWLWFGFIFVFFSLSNTQLPHYLLYGTTPLFLLMAKYRNDLQSKLLAYVPLVLWLALLAILPDVLHIAAAEVDDAYTRAMVQSVDSVFGTGYRIGIIAALIITLGFFFMRGKPVWQGLLMAGALHTFVIVQWVGPAAGELLQQPVKSAARQARQYTEPVVMWRINMPSFTVYRQQVTPRRDPRAGEIVFTRIDALPDLGAHEVIFKQYGIVLAKKLSE
ncbi:MAG: glycosyltransferase family 39 protein [Gammaproteobacteria bacterium]|jgi:4-amino-4-deoxy-L-arabinose transferase-like glycosyltransferase|nr:glycosyltransferase family 39 protein [Gammaproteobacteria bacterium]